MIEKIVYDFLKSNLDVLVVTEEHGEEELPYVRIEKTGGGENGYLKTSVIVIQSYARTLMETAELNEIVKEAMKNLIALDEVCKCELNSDYNYTDTAKKRNRYQAVFDLVHY